MHVGIWYVINFLNLCPKFGSLAPNESCLCGSREMCLHCKCIFCLYVMRSLLNQIGCFSLLDFRKVENIRIHIDSLGVTEKTIIKHVSCIWNDEKRIDINLIRAEKIRREEQGSLKCHTNLIENAEHGVKQQNGNAAYSRDFLLCRAQDVKLWEAQYWRQNLANYNNNYSGDTEYRSQSGRIGMQRFLRLNAAQQDLTRCRAQYWRQNLAYYNKKHWCHRSRTSMVCSSRVSTKIRRRLQDQLLHFVVFQ